MHCVSIEQLQKGKSNIQHSWRHSFPRWLSLLVKSRLTVRILQKILRLAAKRELLYDVDSQSPWAINPSLFVLNKLTAFSAANLRESRTEIAGEHKKGALWRLLQLYSKKFRADSWLHLCKCRKSLISWTGTPIYYYVWKWFKSGSGCAGP